jgi:outer membrane protein OmpA-like peptidoglycan-associated protein
MARGGALFGALLVALAPLAPPQLIAQEAQQRLDGAVERLERDRALQLEFLAPRSFERALEAVERGRSAVAEGGSEQEVERFADEAHAALAEGERLADLTGPVLQEPLEARSYAAAARAPDFAPEEWERAENELREAGVRAERMDDDAVNRAERAAEAFRQAHRSAIHVEVLGPAEELRAAAKDADAEKRAPITLAHADTMFAQAEVMLQDDPPRLEQARDLATAAAEEYRHAELLAVLADSVSDEDVTPEQILLRHEAHLAALAAALEFTPHFAEGADAIADLAVDATLSLQADRRNLRSDLDLRSAEVERLIAQVDELDSRLADVEQREARVSAELRDRERKQQKLREIRAVFDPNEAEILATDDRVTIRLTALSFASGSAELGPENFDVLTKLQRVVREFPTARITVEGHTDNVGNDAANQALSQRRAIAVRDYLLQNVAMSADRLTAVGYGKNRPIAPNDTAEGRAANRRIDVTIDATDG